MGGVSTLPSAGHDTSRKRKRSRSGQAPKFCGGEGRVVAQLRKKKGKTAGKSKVRRSVDAIGRGRTKTSVQLLNLAEMLAENMKARQLESIHNY